MNEKKFNEILGKLKVPSTNTAERAKYRALTAFEMFHTKPRSHEESAFECVVERSMYVRCSGAAVLRPTPAHRTVNFLRAFVSSCETPSLLHLCAVASIVVVLVAAVTIFSQPRQTDASEKLLAQVSQLFPDRLNAVIERNGVAEIDLAETADPALIADQPLVVKFMRGGEKIKVLSFSGRIVQLEIDGKEVTFETLVTADGQVIVSGDDFLWSHDTPNPLLGYRIQAQPLIASL